MRFPSKKEIEDVLNSLTEDDYVQLLDDDASNVDKLKFELCSYFVIYLREENITQAELARRLDIDRSRVNWIIKYRIEHFTIDRLYSLLEIIKPGVLLKVS
jgi:predicted XRE-type DNA-binding protein